MANELTLIVNKGRENAPTLRGGGPFMCVTPLGEGTKKQELDADKPPNQCPRTIYEKVATVMWDHDHCGWVDD